MTPDVSFFEGVKRCFQSGRIYQKKTACSCFARVQSSANFTSYCCYMGVSKNKGGPPKSSILGYPNFWKHPYGFQG